MDMSIFEFLFILMCKIRFFRQLSSFPMKNMLTNRKSKKKNTSSLCPLTLWHSRFGTIQYNWTGRSFRSAYLYRMRLVFTYRCIFLCLWPLLCSLLHLRFLIRCWNVYKIILNISILVIISWWILLWKD